MANTKTSDLTANTAPASGDLVSHVDISDTSMAATGTNKKATVANLITKGHGLSDGAVVSVVSGALASNAVTSTAAELNALHGIPAGLTATEIGYVDGVTSAIQTQVDGKQPLDSDLTTIAGLTATTNNFMQSKTSAWASRTPTQVTADLDAMVGDSGSGGTKGLVPAPASGDTAAGKFLKANGVWTAISAGSGQTLFDAIVAPSGGDYTTLSAAVTAGKLRIFVRSGSYTETGSIALVSGMTIIGEDRENTIIDFSGNAYQFTFSGSSGTHKVGLLMHNFTILNSTASKQMVLDYAEDVVIDNVKFQRNSTDSTNRRMLDFGGNEADNCIVRNCQFINSQSLSATIAIVGAAPSGTNRHNYFINNYCYSTGNIDIWLNAISYWIVTGNSFIVGAAIDYAVITGTQTVFANNYIQYNGLSGQGVLTMSGNNSIITGNLVRVATNGAYAIDIGGSGTTVTGNYIIMSGTSQRGINVSTGSNVVSGNCVTSSSTTSTVGIYLASGNGSSITGNYVTGCGTGFTEGAGSNNIVTGNSLNDGNTTPVTLGAFENNTIYNNKGESAATRRISVSMKNTSGSTIAAGAVVVWKAVAAGNEITTTTTGSDNYVLGIAAASITNNATGNVIIEGKTVQLKADGTTDIAIGDFLTTFTSAGIAAKAAATNLAFAIALEAYTTDDSSGVLDAILITPRRL